METRDSVPLSPSQVPCVFFSMCNNLLIPRCDRILLLNQNNPLSCATYPQSDKHTIQMKDIIYLSVYTNKMQGMDDRFTHYYTVCDLNTSNPQ